MFLILEGNIFTKTKCFAVMDLIRVIILVNLIPSGRYNGMISIMEGPKGSFDKDKKEIILSLPVKL